MQTECSADLFGFARVEGRAVVAGFDGGKMTSDAGALQDVGEFLEIAGVRTAPITDKEAHTALAAFSR